MEEIPEIVAEGDCCGAACLGAPAAAAVAFFLSLVVTVLESGSLTLVHTPSSNWNQPSTFLKAKPLGLDIVREMLSATKRAVILMEIFIVISV